MQIISRLPRPFSVSMVTGSLKFVPVQHFSKKGVNVQEVLLCYLLLDIAVLSLEAEWDSFSVREQKQCGAGSTDVQWEGTCGRASL